MEPLRKPRARPANAPRNGALARVSDRGNELAVIHIRAEVAGLIVKARPGFAKNDDEYRALVRTVSNNTTDSAKTLDSQQRQTLLGMIEAVCRTRGIAPAKRRVYAPLSRMQAKVFALWKALDNAGVLRNAEVKSLRTFVRRQASVDALEFCDAAACVPLIEGLKAWAKRENVALKG